MSESGVAELEKTTEVKNAPHPRNASRVGRTEKMTKEKDENPDQWIPLVAEFLGIENASKEDVKALTKENVKKEIRRIHQNAIDEGLEIDSIEEIERQYGV